MHEMTLHSFHASTLSKDRITNLFLSGTELLLEKLLAPGSKWGNTVGPLLAERLKGSDFIHFGGG